MAAFAESDSPAEASSIYLFSLDNFEQHALTFPPKGVLGDSDPIFSPDGKSIAFLRDYLDTQEIFTVPVQGSALNNWKLKTFTGGGTEVTAGAYPASVTTDIVQITITARKLL